jgi:glycosyltransferase involved in cell wall biosynthesis
VMIEAMACGTPVIAYNCGSAPEVVDDAVTGRLVNGEDEAVVAYAAVRTLDRRAVRRRFDRRFSAVAMARSYLDLYADRLARLPFAAELVSGEDQAENAQVLAQIA